MEKGEKLVEKGNLLEGPLPNPIRTSKVCWHRAIAVQEHWAEQTSGE